VLLLPHAYEGQGPEHSSARLERFLQMCAEDNIQVVYPTTPAQYFHMLRRQVKRKFRKPLVVMTPKSLLRYTDKKPMEHQAASPVSEFTAGRFREVLDDTKANPDAVTRVLLCSGKVYYDLAAKRDELNTQAVAVVRLEQLYPWPGDQLAAVFARYRRCREWVWVQEESQNMGGWSFAEPRLRAMNFPFEYVGRDASASPATGSHHVHEREQKLLVDGAFATNPSGPIGPGYVGWVEPGANGSNGDAKPATTRMKPGDASA
jgi:2-oxoglutarate dehydrogenase E1 component